MKKIEFGYANDQEPKGSWQGIGINEELPLMDAQYYGVVNYGKDSFLVAKVLEDEYGRYPELVSNFLVRPALADMFADGSGIMYLDQEQSKIGHEIETYLNRVKEHIDSFDDVLKYCDFVQRGNRFFDLVTDGDRVISTSIKHDVFESKNNALKNCHQTFSDLQRQNELSIGNNFSR